jgi:aspartyl-tRNA(Asn)/glutamyl-tRNA(Gln) amidotransferase subunit A
MMNAIDLHFLSAAEIGARYANRTLSPPELLESLLARIVALEPRLHAFVRLDAEGAVGR